ncbi:MAG: hypothetical protein ACSW8J_01315 [bacterium]
MMKRIFSLMVAAALALCGMAMATEVPPPEAATDADSDWYMAVLTDAELMEQFPYRAFADVNGEGIPVLFIATKADAFIGDEDRARLYACVDGEAKQLMEIGGVAGEMFYVNAEEHTLTYFYRYSGEGHIEVYNLKDGERKFRPRLVLVTKVDRYGPFHAPDGDNTEQVYFQDDEPIDEAAYEALMDKYANEKDLIAFEAIEK